MSCERADLKRRLRPSLAILCLFLVASATANDKAKEEAHSLLKAAAERSLLAADRQFPFRLDANFTVHGLGANRLDGRYSWALTSSGDWAKQLAFADYNDWQIGRGDTLWEKRSVDFQPLQAALVQNAVYVNIWTNPPIASIGITRYLSTTGSCAARPYRAVDCATQLA
jgi:hypothetical protein